MSVLQMPAKDAQGSATLPPPTRWGPLSDKAMIHSLITNGWSTLNRDDDAGPDPSALYQ